MSSVSHDEDWKILLVQAAFNRGSVLEHVGRPLCDIQSFTAELETAYSTVFQRYLQGLLPDHMYVES